MRKVLLILTLVVLFGSTLLYGQKYGHCNLGSLIALMPETKAADSQLEAYQKELVAKGEDMATKFQENYAAFVKDAQSGDMTPKQQQERQNALQQEQQAIQEYEQEINQKLSEKREELLKPLFDKASEAIKAVAKENGYVMIFDTSVFNAVLFANDTDDVMPLVKTKLGL